MRIRRLALSAAVCLSLLACTGNSAPANPPSKPLSKAELARLKDAVLSIGEVTSLVNSYTNRTGAKPPPHALFMALLAPVAGDESPLKKVIDESDCQKVIHYPDEQPPLKAGDNSLPVFSIDISGPGCPVTYHAGLDGTQLANGLKANLVFKYAAISDEARKAADVDASDLHGIIEASSTQTPDGQASMSFSMDFGGNGHSQKEGSFAMGDKIAGSMAVSFGAPPPAGQPAPPPGQGGFPSISITGEMDETSTFAFHSMTGELTSKTTILGMGQQTADYRINGAVVTEKEYKELHDALKLPGLQSGAGQQPANPYTLSCTSRVYPGQAMPVATLQKDLDQGHLPAVQGLSEFHSCSDMPKQDSNVTQMGSGQIETMFDFTNPAVAKAQMRLCVAGSPCQATQRYFLPNETKGFAEMLGDYSVVTFCEPKPACH
jgi:hypothetical protein